nr:hypothetical protein BaRGS_011657 [Batillaria attramentaria]
MIEVPGHGLWKVSLVEEEEECPGQVTWSRDATLKLIELYKEHQVYLNDHHYKKKSVWEIIATRLRKETSDPTQYRWNQAENKWKNITKKYRDCVDNNRRHGTNVRCRFYDEIAAVYNYNPDDQAQKTAAEGLRALSSTRPQVIKLSDMGESSTATHQNYVRTKHERPSADDESFINGTGAEDAAVPLLAKKKKYARLDSATTATAQQHTPLTSATVNLVSAPLVSASPSQAAPKVSQCDDILAVLKELREDRQRQEKARMDRLENMHQEKMQLFRQFLDLLKQSKQT